MLEGTIRVFLAQALFPVTALITTAFLTRRLGAEGYGLLVLAASLVVWVEVSINSLFSRAAIKFVGNAEDWRPIGSAIARLHLIASGCAAVLLVLLSVPLAQVLNEPLLRGYLCLFALDIPLAGLAHAYRDVLVGSGGFAQGALMSAGRWIARLLLIVLLVELGLSVPGAILGSLGASLVELTIGRRYVRLSLFHRAPVAVPPSFWSYALPLFLSALSLSCYTRLDLFALKVLGGTAVQAGVYGAAQNLSLLPGLFAASFSPLLLATLSRLLRDGRASLAREISRNAMRAVLALLPVAAMIAGATHEIVGFFFGTIFLPAAQLLGMLIFGAVALVMMSVAIAIVTAAGKPRWTLILTGPLVPLAVIGHLVLIPRFGALGASIVTTLLAGLGALVAMLAVYRLWQIVPPTLTLGRSILVSGLAYTLSTLWPVSGSLVLAKLLVISSAFSLAFLVLGELRKSEIAMLASFLPWRTARAASTEGLMKQERPIMPTVPRNRR
jgi:O-antigen/teichoic acid export membrane protein